MRRLLFPLLIGVLGTAVLLGLGTWQVQRLLWKEGVLAEIDARIGAAPVALPEAPDPAADRFLPVTASGTIEGAPLRVLAGLKGAGAGYRLVSTFDTGGRRVLLDRGFVPVQAAIPGPSGPITVTGNLHWPDESDSYTPPPEGDLWFARDVDAMAAALGTEPVLIVARRTEPAETGLVPMPVDSSGIPNDHLEYAITWFSLAAIWMGMTGYWLWRNRARSDEAGTA